MSDKRHIFLTGFMGSGKSSVGKLLAEKFSLSFIDLDAVIVEREELSINQIFEQFGEERFREIETEALQSAIDFSPSVVATGGGVVISPLNRRIMHENGVVINLLVSAEEVIKRVAGCDDRPLLAGADRFDKVICLMNNRKQFYSDADIQIDTDGKSMEDVAIEIITFLTGKFKRGES